MTDSMRDRLRDELAGWPINSGYYSTAVSVDDARDMADAVLAVLADPSADDARAEAERDKLLAKLEKVRAYVDTLPAHPPLGANWMRWADQVIVRLRSILDGDGDESR